MFIKRGILVMFLLLAGCSSKPEDKLKEYFECQRAASVFGDTKAALKAEKKLKKYFKDNLEYFKSLDTSPSMLGLRIKEAINNDLKLYRYNRIGRLRIWKKVYNSDMCQEIYK